MLIEWKLIEINELESEGFVAASLVQLQFVVQTFACAYGWLSIYTTSYFIFLSV